MTGARKGPLALQSCPDLVGRAFLQQGNPRTFAGGRRKRTIRTGEAQIPRGRHGASPPNAAFSSRRCLPAPVRAVLLLLLLVLAPAATAAPAFTADGPMTSDSGYFMIEWEADGPVTLEMARDAGFGQPEVLYAGMNHATFVSGLADGDYYVRLRSDDGNLSEPLRLSVAHQSLERALWLVALGAVVFLSIVAVIARGAADE